MEVNKIRNLSDDELSLEERKTAEQLFRLRFQMKLGQTEGVKKLRELRKDVARIKTVARQRQLGLEGATPKAEGTATKKKSAKAAGKKAVKKSGFTRKASSRSTAARSAAKPSGNKKTAARSASVKKG
jgi:large subunit ribosomal protein L29